MKTALITGSSEGIGLEFARIFAQNKINLILVARNEKKLTEIAEELAKNNIEVTIYAKDLSKIENAIFIYNDIRSKGIKIDYLINNAGFAINESFVNIPWQREYDMLNLNMITLTYFTKVFAAEMKERREGRIMNIASTAAFQPTPYLAGYSATKAYVLNLTEAVNFELKGSGVTATTLCPGVTDTGFHEVAQTDKSNLLRFSTHSTAREVAEYGYALMMKGKALGIHGFFNKVMAGSVRFASRKAITKIAGKLMNPRQLEKSIK